MVFGKIFNTVSNGNYVMADNNPFFGSFSWETGAHVLNTSPE